MVRPQKPQHIKQVNRLNRKQRTHCDCGNQLRPDQAWFCSHVCRDKFNNSEHKNAQKGYLAEPRTTKEIEKFYDDLEKGKQRILSQNQKLVDSLTPVDDSPETERKFREAICPNPIYNGMNLSKSFMTVKERIIRRP